ncbi:dsDNA nuclease domain-containing protein [Jeotgalicoccus halotolerans]|uniref:Uncharacterized protein DUF4297 n=1 Tax=Jeotgalicoccus halotolerans TaxID=157227 RepID=A0A3E0B0L8_9STAP|nr:dsDNA nuclease domain-containing protein [Jeotgalicoccus halotolerans]REG25475.1 uncharacterized protein DUF4297 [Jeotgalicoccus halotolerans]
MSIVDNGGAFAIKGFNYQKAAIIFVMIHHFEKNNFKIVPESKDDFEVYLDDQVYYIQVKGTKKLSIAKLKSKPKGKESIIEKNLFPGVDNDNRKIFLWDLAETTKSELTKVRGTLFPEKYQFSDKQKMDLAESLELNPSQLLRLEHQFIYVTPFTNDLEKALIMLKGYMVEEELLVTNERVSIVLSELALEIDQKSEILIDVEEDFVNKEIDGNYLKKIFTRVKQKEMFDEVLNNLILNTRTKEKIRAIKLRIPLLHTTLKEEIKEKIVTNEVMDCNTDEDAIRYIRSLIGENIATELSIALAIDYFCEIEEV